MGYCTKADLITEKGVTLIRNWTNNGMEQYGEDDKDEYGIVVPVVEAAITKSQENIDAALRTLFSALIPFPASVGGVPPVLKNISLAEVVWLLASGLGSEKLEGTSYLLNYQMALTRLNRIAGIGVKPEELEHLWYGDRDLTEEAQGVRVVTISRNVRSRSSTYGQTAVFGRERLTPLGHFPK